MKLFGYFDLSAALVAALVILLVALMPAPAQGCSPLPGGASRPLHDMIDKLDNSSIVVYGYGIEKIEDKAFPNGDVYSLRFEVRCVYKRGDDDVNYMININNIGRVPGFCFETVIEPGKPVIAYLYKQADNSYRPSFSADSGESVFREELMGACHYNPEYPLNADLTKIDEEECLVDYDYPGGCGEEDPPVEPPKPSPPTPPANTDKPMDKPEAKPTPGATKDNGENGDGKDVPYGPAKGDDDDNNGSPLLATFSFLLLLASLLTVAIL